MAEDAPKPKRRDKKYLTPFYIERGLENYHKGFPRSEGFWRKIPANDEFYQKAVNE